MTDRRRFLVLGASAPLALAARAARAQSLEEITYLLPAPLQQIAFAPWLLAQQRGYYAAEGLRVTFQPGRGGVDVAKNLGSGSGTIGTGFGDTPIISRAQGIPIRSVALLGGRSMTQIVAHADAGIASPKDLKGKTVTAMSYADSNYYALLGMLAAAGINKNEVNTQAAGPTGVWQLFVQRRSDAMAAVPEWVAEARAAGANLRIMPAHEYTQSMAQAIIATDEVIQKRPETVRKVVRATLRGLRDLMSNPKGAIPDYVAAMPSFKGREAFVDETFALYNQYVWPGQRVLGQMDAERLGQLQKTYLSQGIIQKETPVGELFTNQFVGG